MGVAAYRRGTAVIVRQIEQEAEKSRQPIEFEIMDNLNALPRGHRTLFGDTVIRTLNGRFHLMNAQEGGWERYSYEYHSLRELFADWNVIITGLGTDKHSFFYRVTNGV